MVKEWLRKTLKEYIPDDLIIDELVNSAQLDSPIMKTIEKIYGIKINMFLGNRSCFFEGRKDCDVTQYIIVKDNTVIDLAYFDLGGKQIKVHGYILDKDIIDSNESNLKAVISRQKDQIRYFKSEIKQLKTKIDKLTTDLELTNYDAIEDIP